MPVGTYMHVLCICVYIYMCFMMSPLVRLKVQDAECSQVQIVQGTLLHNSWGCTKTIINFTFHCH